MILLDLFMQPEIPADTPAPRDQHLRPEKPSGRHWHYTLMVENIHKF